MALGMDCMILEKNLLMSLPLLTIDNRLHSAISATLGIVQWISGIFNLISGDEVNATFNTKKFAQFKIEF